MVATDTLIEAFRRFDPGRGPFGPFVCGILQNRILDHYRRQRREALCFVSFPEQFDPPDNRAARAIELSISRDELLTAIRCLPLEDQLLIKLHYFNGLSLDEIARLS